MSASATITPGPTGTTVVPSSSSSLSYSRYNGYQTSTDMGGNGGTAMSGIWYAGIVLALIIAFFASFIGRRTCKARRARKMAAVERADLERRGEAAGLPTYRETTLGSRPTFAQLAATRGHTTTTTISSPIPSSHPLYAPSTPAVAATRAGTHGLDQEVVRGGGGDTAVEPPAYDGPPKYA